MGQRYNVLKKEFNIGDYDFTLAVNREMAVKFFRVNAEYFDSVIKIEGIEDKYRRGETMSAEDVLETAYLTDRGMSAAEEIVRAALPELLAYGAESSGTPLDNAEEYAEKILAFCEENDILYNVAYEDDEGATATFKGFLTLVMEFISLGFTSGNGKPNKKPTIAIKVK